MGGGGSGGGGFSSDDLAKLQEAAVSKLKDAAAKSTLLLFAAEEVDRRSLDSHLARSTDIFPPAKIRVFDGRQAEAAIVAVAAVSFVILFTNAAKETAFLNKISDEALLQRKIGIHVRAGSDSIIPSKVTANRWRSVSWAELEQIFG